MKKTDALIIANGSFDSLFTNKNTHFSKVNKAKPVWWLEIPIRKLDDPSLPDINLLLEENGTLKWLRVSTSVLTQHFSGFKVRLNKDVICLELDTSNLKNVVGSEKLSFRQFLQN